MAHYSINSPKRSHLLNMVSSYAFKVKFNPEFRVKEEARLKEVMGMRERALKRQREISLTRAEKKMNGNKSRARSTK